LTFAVLFLAPAESWGKTKPRKPDENQAVVTSRMSGNPATQDQVAEWRQIDQESRRLLEVVKTKPKDVPSRQGLADLAVRSAAAAELALARGDEDLFRAFREQIASRFHETRWRLDQMAGKGNGGADFALGVLALHGILDQRNVEQACGRFAAALQKGFLDARFRHGQCLEEKDPAAARAHYEKAARTGNPAAMERLGWLCMEASQPDIPCATRWLESAAKNGRASAKTLLGWMYVEGIGGQRDLARAAALYREAAQQGDPSAWNNFGELQENGRGVPKDERAAFESYRQAAELGFPAGQFNLGRLYAGGKGVEKNIPEARRWLGKAAKAGIGNAQKILELLEAEQAPQRGPE
jgi:TPR repeat protein